MDMIGWSTKNANGDYSKVDIFNGHVLLANSYKRENRDISYDNAPGGWLAPLYTINSNPDNTPKRDPIADIDRQYIKTSFMSTTSTFGLIVTEDNIFNTHESYSADDTPFDVIRGMETNEEHVRISDSTGEFLKRELDNDLEFTIRPRNRENEELSETVSGKLSYDVNNTIIFAGNDNAFVFKNTADVNINSRNTIQFLPGFIIEEGAKVSAKITGSKKSFINTSNSHQKINYLKPSPYIGKITKYGIKKIVEGKENSTITIYPNPSDGIFSIVMTSNNIETETFIKVYNNLGLVLFKEKMNSEGIFTLDLSSFSSGLYQIEIIQGETSYFKKVIKI